ncbi:PREDICTED: von Willebrand factor A domain-containing protein DDB_G0286969 [Fragaria vesca subsp. vesca]|uniref:von Willebrand factor A domain-containing protein DDB_G0286969 n=1 Tax=Fragaria vesca subsp. vesca TaxID=101020 RepID=UPI0002C3684E|nr:PREDICTED: von Willebrand factor A domain-containing protein DDB_G0286969 [Fragaria vesca subsp. vesca]
MAGQFSSCVEYGLAISKRILYGKESVPAPPAMSRSSSHSSQSRPSPEQGYLPESPMVYAAVSDPAIVDNPDIPSYQPYVYGRCEPPALIPLHMHGVALEVESYLETAFVTVTGNWRVHCISTGKSCDCRVAVPMGEQGSLLGVEVDVTGSSYRSQLITTEGAPDSRKVAKEGYFLKRHIYTLKVPQVEGGSFISLKIRWSQKLLYHDGKFCLSVPFNFPAYVNPLGNKNTKGENISLSVNMGADAEVLCQITSHPLKVVRRHSGKLSLSYEAQVAAWSSADFSFSYIVKTKDVYGGVFLQSPTLRDFDDREMFCFYLIPGNSHTWKVFKKEVIFIIDISGSMVGGPLENAKSAVLASLSNLNHEDTFNIIAFNGEVHLFSSSMELATNEALLKAKNWVTAELIADGGTNILLPLRQAMKLLAKTADAIPFIFLITDGAVEDEREICNMMKGYLTSEGSTCPRISTFGIGLYCNHYFLQMLAQIGRGYYDAAYNGESIDCRVQRLFTRASSVTLANITVDAFEHLDSLELFPSHMLDLSSGSPLIISGRYEGRFPPSIKVSGTLADMSNFATDLKVQRSKDFPLDRVLAKRHIDMLTAHAWLLGSKDLQEKVSKMSIQTGVPSEYTSMTLVRTDKGKKALELTRTQEVYIKVIQRTKSESCRQKDIILGSLGVGFGNLVATVENKAPESEEPKPSDVAEVLVKAASTCCCRVLDRICCMCFIRTCTHVNNQCAIVLTQLCAALCCCECLNCCFELFS